MSKERIDTQRKNRSARACQEAEEKVWKEARELQEKSVSDSVWRSVRRSVRDLIQKSVNKKIMEELK